MKVHQVYTQSVLRNFTYLIELDDKTAIALDPWDDHIVNGLLIEKKLTLIAIINTHEHWDHVQGNLALVKQHQCEVWAHENGQGKIPGLTRTLSKGELITLDDSAQLRVLDTPGHTLAHLCFLVQVNGRAEAIFTGDTLFNAGVGHCHLGGDVNVLYNTISEQFHVLEDHIKVYPGHEYLENNLNFTLSLEPTNQDAEEWLERAKKSDPCINPLTTTIGDEKKFNTFFRLGNQEIRRSVGGLDNDQEVFAALRALRNNW